MKRLVCWLLGHDWPATWGDNGCYGHDLPDENGVRHHDHLMTRFCRRCDDVDIRTETLF